MATVTKEQRTEIENLVYQFMDALDKSGTNTEYYKGIFNEMNDAQFTKFISKDFPFKFHYRPSVVEPTMSDIEESLNVIGVPFLEKISEPFLYENKDGVPVTTKECFVGYDHLKKVQQIVTKKNKTATDVANRDMRTGRLNGADKGAVLSDREFESLAVLGFDKTIEEFSRSRADAMNDKNVMNNTINSLGMVRLSDLPKDKDDSLSKNMMNVYLIGAGFNSNLINEGNYTAYTLKQRKKNINRY